jgi:hypothetical protein
MGCTASSQSSTDRCVAEKIKQHRPQLMQQMALRQQMRSSQQYKSQLDLMDEEPGCEAFIDQSFESLRKLLGGIHNNDGEAVAQAALEGMELQEHPMYRKICMMKQDQTVRSGSPDSFTSFSSASVDSSALQANSSALQASTICTCHNDASIKSVKRVRFILPDDNHQ